MGAELKENNIGFKQEIKPAPGNVIKLQVSNNGWDQQLQRRMKLPQNKAVRKANQLRS